MATKLVWRIGNHRTITLLNLIDRPTRVTSSTSTLIDYIFTNTYHRMETPEQGLFLSNMSDHYPIFHMDSIKKKKVMKTAQE